MADSRLMIDKHILISAIKCIQGEIQPGLKLTKMEYTQVEQYNLDSQRTQYSYLLNDTKLYQLCEMSYKYSSIIDKIAFNSK